MSGLLKVIDMLGDTITALQAENAALKQTNELLIAQRGEDEPRLSAVQPQDAVGDA